MNGLSRKASLLASYLGWHVSTGARGSWSGWSSGLEGAAHVSGLLSPWKWQLLQDMWATEGPPHGARIVGRGSPICLAPGTTWLPVYGLDREMKYGCPAQP